MLLNQVHTTKRNPTERILADMGIAHAQPPHVERDSTGEEKLRRASVEAGVRELTPSRIELRV